MVIVVDRTATFIDKSTWGPGPWQDEPDKIQYQDPDTGFVSLAVRHPHSGHWCGYVGVPEGHPAFGLDYNAASDLGPEQEGGWCGLDVHGGLTTATFCQEGREEQGICHVPLPGQPERVWWLGFDMAHSGDLTPGSRSFTLMLWDGPGAPRDTYRTLEYVQEQCALLAKQLLAIVPQPAATTEITEADVEPRAQRARPPQ